MDGQQRITSLYAIRKGIRITKDGKEIDYQDIYINLDFDPKTDEQISVVEKVEGKNYISVHRLLNADVTDLMVEYDRDTLKRASAFKNNL